MRSIPRGRAFRISLTYDEPMGSGKISAHTDTYHGLFVKLVANEQVVELVEFETADPDLRGEMTITISLADADGGGTDVLAVHDGLPSGMPIADNEAGWREALAKLAALVERVRTHKTSYLSLMNSAEDPKTNSATVIDRSKGMTPSPVTAMITTGVHDEDLHP
jgi:hypothetical protein